ncbi:dipeptidase [Winogradskyella immobilis]|uniref:Membrane dipeptidase n=1 Tax=Winogradskyella immobilis TaxID=2816852 RepID=A0ABS8ERE4_9FLAO|nr:membrane dipeptidase [Winogradskyella immobilis]MCC1485105.1 membrane dipeptidase [Winogradskyella immobilis]MCG0017197.1 membrane dipeptidase [Winogradskyella immobilis]
MGSNKNYKGYKSFQYLEKDIDYKHFEQAKQVNRVSSTKVPLNEAQEQRVAKILKEEIIISVHEHLGTFPKDIMQTPAYIKEGRMFTGFEGLAAGHWDCVFDNLMNGVCQIHSKGGWKWSEVTHDLGMRLCDIAHQDFVIHCKTVDDIYRAHKEGKVAWVAVMEGSMMIENELDRLDLLYGFGLRSIGITYSESNALGSGLKEIRDGGLTQFGKRAVERMNKVGLLIDVSHCGDQTALDTIAHSKKPIIVSHIGAKALWNTNRMAPDDVFKACADKGGVIGIEAAPHTTLTPNNRIHNLDAVMEHFEYVKDLVGIDHVTLGPDTLYGDHVGLHRAYTAALSLKASKSIGKPGMEYEPVEFVDGLENPTEGSYNIVRWLVKHDYTDEQIAKIMGKNTLRLLKDVWV